MTGTYPTPNSIASLHGAETTSDARRVISAEEAEHLDKVLNILAGRTEELRERLRAVLLPAQAIPSGSDQKSPQIPGSMLSERFRAMRSVAESAIGTVDDILSRLDI